MEATTEPRKHTLEEVFNEIRKERNYQDWKYGEDQKYPLAQFIVDLDVLSTDMKRNGYDLNQEKVLESIRKITALGVKCMQVHGLGPRR